MKKKLEQVKDRLYNNKYTSKEMVEQDMKELMGYIMICKNKRLEMEMCRYYNELFLLKRI